MGQYDCNRVSWRLNEWMANAQCSLSYFFQIMFRFCLIRMDPMLDGGHLGSCHFWLVLLVEKFGNSVRISITTKGSSWSKELRTLFIKIGFIKVNICLYSSHEQLYAVLIYLPIQIHSYFYFGNVDKYIIALASSKCCFYFISHSNFYEENALIIFSWTVF